MQGYRGFSGTVVDGVTTQVTIDDGSTFSVVQGIYSGNRFAPGLTLATTNSGAFNSPQFIFISPDAGVLNSLTSGATIGLTSGQVTSGFIGNAAVVSGSYASGSIGPLALASGTALGNIPSGTITQQYLASGVGGGGGGALTSGQVQSGDIGNNAVTSGNYASGSIGQYALASGVGGGGSFSFTSGCVPSGSLASPVVFSGNIASGQVGNKRHWQWSSAGQQHRCGSDHKWPDRLWCYWPICFVQWDGTWQHRIRHDHTELSRQWRGRRRWRFH